MKRIHDLNLNPVMRPVYKTPLILTQGHKQFVWDDKGNRYLDMFAGICTVAVGHCHPRLVQRASQQIDKLWHVSTLYWTEEIHAYAQELARRFPAPLQNIFFCNSGSEANDIAITMARLYTGAFDLIGLRNCYHGCSPSTMALCGVGNWKFAFPSAFGMQWVTCPDVYNGRYGGKACRDSPVQTTRQCSCSPGQCEACDKYMEEFDEVMNTSVPRRKIAGMMVESIQGVGGVTQYPKGYLKRAFAKIRERGGVCIADEVQAGFGRTGSHFWGFQGHDVTPDIVTMAKGIGNGFPLAAVITTDEIAKVLLEASFFNTYGGNPMACAIGKEVLSIIDDEHLMENSKHVGTRLLKKLARLRDEFGDFVGDVRGKGLMIGVEMVKDKESRLPMNKEHVDAIFEDCREMGLLIGRGGPYGNVFRIKPPMSVTDEHTQFTVDVMRIAFQNHSMRCKK